MTCGIITWLSEEKETGILSQDESKCYVFAQSILQELKKINETEENDWEEEGNNGWKGESELDYGRRWAPSLPHLPASPQSMGIRQGFYE